MAKTREYECPKCGEFEEVYNSSDPEIDITEEDGEVYEFVVIERRCHKCGHHWTEYMRLTYDGCYTDGKLYNKNGEEEREEE